MHFKSQSAMEYLMTYGWAILIVAIVLVAIFELGFFNSANFMPRAEAGACSIFRGVQGISLEGQCNNELPQFVGQFSGTGSSIMVASARNLNASYITISAWINPSSYNCASDHCIILNKENQYEIAITDGTGSFNAAMDPSWAWYGPSTPLPIGQWSFVAITWDGVTQEYYVNGYPVYSINAGSGPIAPQNYCLQIGARGGCGSSGSLFPGDIADVQVYNTTLSANQIYSLYVQGIGSPPVSAAYSVGWWPLNGNAQDYSGNENSGTASSGVSYTSSWTYGYSLP